MTKKEIRQRFRDAVFKRAKYACQGPGCTMRATKETAEQNLDAHHVTDRHEFRHGGYVPENGIALCAYCHEKAEEFHRTGEAFEGFAPEELYLIINSSREKAEAADSVPPDVASRRPR